MKFRRPRNVVWIDNRTSCLRAPRKRITKLVGFVARAERRAVAEVDVAVVNAHEITRLNRRYLRHAGLTDVLCFDLGQPGEPIMAQIVVCAEVAIRQAKRFGHSPQRELLLYVVHALLHLMGYNDAKPAQAARMQRRQEELLRRFLETR